MAGEPRIVLPPQPIIMACDLVIPSAMGSDTNHREVCACGCAHAGHLKHFAFTEGRRRPAAVLRKLSEENWGLPKSISKNP